MYQLIDILAFQDAPIEDGVSHSLVTHDLTASLEYHLTIECKRLKSKYIKKYDVVILC